MAAGVWGHLSLTGGPNGGSGQKTIPGFFPAAGSVLSVDLRSVAAHFRNQLASGESTFGITHLRQCGAHVSIASRIYAKSEWGTKGGIVAVLLFGLNLQVAQSGDDAQPYALCMFFCLLAWFAALDSRPTTLRMFLVGLAAGAAVNTSLLAAPFFLLLTGWCVAHAARPDRLRRLLWLVCGAAVASIPLAYLAMLAPTQTWFSIVEFQLFYRTAGATQPKDIASHNLHEILDWVRSIQGAVLVVLSLAGWLFLFDRKTSGSIRSSVGYAALIAIIWTVFLTAVRPTFHMYYVLVVPYVSLLAAAGLCQLCAREKLSQWSPKILAGTILLYSLGLAIPLVAGVISRRPGRWAPPDKYSANRQRAGEPKPAGVLR